MAATSWRPSVKAFLLEFNRYYKAIRLRRAKPSKPTSPMPSMLRLEGSGTASTLSLHGVEATTLPPVSSVNPTNIVPIGKLPGAVKVGDVQTLVRHPDAKLIPVS
jgi:hypothetical protein